MRKLAPLSVLIMVLAAELASGATAMAAPHPKPDDSKQAAVIESFRTTYHFENNGTGSRDVTARIKIQSPAGVQQYGVLVFTYSRAFERLQVGYVRVRQPDGTIVATTGSSFQDVTPQVTLSAPEYSDIRQEQVAVKGLVPGSELEYHIRFRVFAPFVPGQFEVSYDFIKHSVVRDEELAVIVPKGRAVKVRNSRVQPTVTTQGNRRFYLWKHRNTKVQKSRRYPDGQAPPPDVLLSSFQSWAQVGRFWRRIARPQEAPTPAIRAKAAQLTKGLTTEQQKLQAIYSYVAQQFRYISISLGVGHYRPHRAAQVLENRYGDCKDKATLLASLLHAAGIKGWMALISAEQQIDPAVPSLGQFDHVITVVPEGGKLQWMDATSEFAPMGLLTFDLRGKHALVVPATHPAYLSSTPRKPSVPNKITFQAKGKLGSDGTFNGELHYTLQGDKAIGMRQLFNSVAASQWPRTVQAIVGGLGFGGTVSHVQVSPPQDTAHPFSFSCQYIRKDYSQWAYGRIIPPVPLAEPASVPAGNAKAHQPFILGEPGQSDYSATLELPKGYSPSPPKGLNLTTPFGSYHSVYSFKNGVLKVERRASVTAELVPIAKFAAYRKFRKAVSSDIDDFIDLQSGAEAGSPDTEFQQDILDAYVSKNLQDNNDAVKHVVHALKLKPDSALAWLMASEIFGDVHQKNAAITAMDKAASLAPHSLQTYQLLTQGLKHVGVKQEKIIQLWHAYIRQNPRDVKGHLYLGYQLFQMRRYPEAAHEFKESLKMDPDNWWPLKELSFIETYQTVHNSRLSSSEKEAKVTQLWQTFIHRHPKNVFAYTNFGNELMQMHRYKEAIRQLQKGLKLYSQDRWAQRHLAAAFVEAGDYRQAVAESEKLVSESPTAENLNDEAYDLARAGLKLPEAEGWSLRSVKAEERRTGVISLGNLSNDDVLQMSGLASYWDTLAWVYFREGKLKEAHRYEAAALAMDVNPVVADHLGQIDEKLGRKSEAIDHYAWAAVLDARDAQDGYGLNATDSRKQLVRMIGSGKRLQSVLRKARKEIARDQTYQIKAQGLKPGKARFFVLLAPNEETAQVKFISGPKRCAKPPGGLRRFTMTIRFRITAPSSWCAAARSLAAKPPASVNLFWPRRTPSIRSISNSASRQGKPQRQDRAAFLYFSPIR